MNKLFYLLPFLIFAFALTEEVVDEVAKEQNKPVIPNVKFKDLDNKKFMLEEFYSAGPILLNFWTIDLMRFGVLEASGAFCSGRSRRDVSKSGVKTRFRAVSTHFVSKTDVTEIHVKHKQV